MVAAYNLQAADDLSVPPKHPDSNLVEVNKIGRNHLVRSGSSQNVYIYKPRNGLLGQKMRHYETFLVV